ncbi:MAG: nucleoside/nucleotide kinase family protein [Micrococcales bacterium]|nr:nucleoside/nucleotide kinase family protein [Micrococcales bacterium]
MDTEPDTEPGLEVLVGRARRFCSPGATERTILGICGPPGSGKSTLAGRLLDRLRADPPDTGGPGWVAYVPMDGFHLADVQLERLGLRGRKGAPETFDADGYLALLQRIRTNIDRTVYAPGFERDLEQPIAAAIVVPPEARLVLTEGNYLLLDEDPWTAARALLDEVWYVDVDHDLRIARLIARHIAHGKAANVAREWVLRSDEVNARLVEDRQGTADLVIHLHPVPHSVSHPAPRASEQG